MHVLNDTAELLLLYEKETNNGFLSRNRLLRIFYVVVALTSTGFFFGIDPDRF